MTTLSPASPTRSDLSRDSPPRSSASQLAERYRAVRSFSESICDGLEIEDFVVQSMPDASPIKWHLAHTTWFFETFILAEHVKGYVRPQPVFNYLFNSYYNAVGAQFERPRRGLLSRPTVAEVLKYRRVVDKAMADFFTRADAEQLQRLRYVLEVGLNHEQQHQELMLTDLKHMLAQNPLHPVYRASSQAPTRSTQSIAVPAWFPFNEGQYDIGHDAQANPGAFAYDNESPRHTVYLQPFEMASRLVTCGEFIEFIDDGGYERPELWLSEGFSTARDHGWTAPLYWQRDGGKWMQFTLCGLREVDPAEPVCHVSLFEADAYARWKDARLPTEAEWEVAALRQEIREGNFVESALNHPRPLDAAPAEGQMAQLFGDVWEWTGSQYRPYPGYRPPDGALGEYNGKFMCNQFVLRGGSCATSRSHIRATYRNFFPPAARWQFSGIRLARDGVAH